MSNPVKLACQDEVIEIPLARLLPMRLLDDGIRKTSKYRSIEASVREIGLIEPLMVFPQPDSDGCFLLLDGHVRLLTLKDLGVPAAKCLIATDDEGFTYNHKVNHPTAIQEHFMILRAIQNGVSEERIARALSVDVHKIRQKRDLLDGICPEAVELLREKRANVNSLRELRKVRPMRQIEIAELMVATNNFSAGYAKCLVAATTAELLLDGEKGKEVKGLSPEEVSRMEHELESLGREFRLIEESHGKNTVQLVLVAAYLRKVLDNGRVARYLSQHHPEVAAEFRKIAEARNLADGTPTKGLPE